MLNLSSSYYAVIIYLIIYIYYLIKYKFKYFYKRERRERMDGLNQNLRSIYIICFFLLFYKNIIIEEFVFNASLPSLRSLLSLLFLSFFSFIFLKFINLYVYSIGINI